MNHQLLLAVGNGCYPINTRIEDNHILSTHQQFLQYKKHVSLDLRWKHTLQIYRLSKQLKRFQKVSTVHLVHENSFFKKKKFWLKTLKLFSIFIRLRCCLKRIRICEFIQEVDPGSRNELRPWSLEHHGTRIYSLNIYQ